MHPFRILLILSELSEVCKSVRNSISKDYKIHNRKKIIGANFISHWYSCGRCWKNMKSLLAEQPWEKEKRRSQCCWRLTVLINVDILGWNTPGRKHLRRATPLARSVCYFPNILNSGTLPRWILSIRAFEMSTFRFYTTLFIFSVYSATDLLSSAHFCRMSVSYLNNAFWLVFFLPQSATLHTCHYERFYICKVAIICLAANKIRICRQILVEN